VFFKIEKYVHSNSVLWFSQTYSSACQQTAYMQEALRRFDGAEYLIGYLKAFLSAEWPSYGGFNRWRCSSAFCLSVCLLLFGIQSLFVVDSNSMQLYIVCISGTCQTAS